ncbi:MAG: family 43 glycosylhydrolase [Planctomycetota bacterium]|nr:family 43 glycosylhydrolase [Planctomycetota bacterium]
MHVSALIATSVAAPLLALQQPLLLDPGFEAGGVGWRGATVTAAQRHAAPEGRHVALQGGGQPATTQVTDHALAAGEVVTLRALVRSANAPGVETDTRAQLQLRAADGAILFAVTEDVDAPELRGSAATAPSDDGVNVWIDGGHRMHFADAPAWQPLSADPILDPWTRGSDVGFDFDMALGAIITPQGLRALYQTYYEDSGPRVSTISLRRPLPGSSSPHYAWDPSSDVTVLENEGSEFPWVIDAHLFQDPDDGRLWMSWGGHVAWVTELDPATGRVLGNPASPRFSTHAPGTHTRVLCWPESAALGGDPAQPPGWCGDADSTCYMEGAALYKHGGWWYVFGTYGNLEADYTIRMGRSRSPRGPFVDKDGIALTRYDAGLGRYGASMFLAGEGLHAVPGHPHLWREGDRHFLGYDRRRQPADGEDRMAVREVRFVDGWPTIWEPLEVVLRVDDVPGAEGRTLAVGLANVGSPGSVAGFDRVELIVESPCGGVLPVCPGEPNSAAASGARLGLAGSPSIAADELRIAVSDGPGGRNGLLVAGHAPGVALVGDGILCIGPPVTRVLPAALDAAGRATVQVPLSSGPLAGMFRAGDRALLQFWFRDSSPGGSNLSEAVELTLCP